MRPNPGAPRKDFFNKKFYDEQTRVIPKGMNAPRATTTRSNVIINAQLEADATIDTIEPYRPVVLGVGNFITPSSDIQHLQIDTFECYAHTEDRTPTKFNPTWGIALDFITKSSPGRVQLTGGCWLNTTGEVVIPNGNGFDIFNSKLWRCYGGKAEIVGGLPTASWCYVNLSRSTMNWIGMTSSLGMEVEVATDVELYEYHDDSFIGTGIMKSCITLVSDIVGEKFVEISIRSGMLVAMEIC